MYPFEYVAPATLEEALGLLREHGDEGKVLAGGQSLIPILQYRLARPRVVIDINGLPLGDIVVEDGRVRLGALVRHHQLEESDAIARRCPVLGEAARLIGNVRVRTLGTVGGSLAHADPAAELPAVMTALDARLAVAGPSGRRTLAARDFFTGLLTTALAPDEIVTGVEISTRAARSPAPSSGRGDDRAARPQWPPPRGRGAPQPDAPRAAARHARHLRCQGGLRRGCVRRLHRAARRTPGVELSGAGGRAARQRC